MSDDFDILQALIQKTPAKKESVFPTILNYNCPVCAEPITLSIEWETETGEFGTVLSRYPTVNRDSRSIDRHGTCHCAFGAPLVDVIADYLEDGKLEDLLFSHEQVEFDLIEIIRFAKGAMGLLNDKEFDAFGEVVKRVEEFFNLGIVQQKETQS